MQLHLAMNSVCVSSLNDEFSVDVNLHGKLLDLGFMNLWEFVTLPHACLPDGEKHNLIWSFKISGDTYATVAIAIKTILGKITNLSVIPVNVSAPSVDFSDETHMSHQQWGFSSHSSLHLHAMSLLPLLNLELLHQSYYNFWSLLFANKST